MYLYLGYLLVHFSPLMTKLFELNIAMSAMIFSIVIVFIWSFIPFVGYWLAKLFNAKGTASKYMLFIFGLGIGAIENSLFYFDFLTNKQTIIGTFVAFFLFFVVAYISTNKTEIDPLKTANK